MEMIDKTVCNNASTKDVLHRSLICIIYRIAYNFGGVKNLRYWLESPQKMFVRCIIFAFQCQETHPLRALHVKNC